MGKSQRFPIISLVGRECLENISETFLRIFLVNEFRANQVKLWIWKNFETFNYYTDRKSTDVIPDIEYNPESKNFCLRANQLNSQNKFYQLIFYKV